MESCVIQKFNIFKVLNCFKYHYYNNLHNLQNNLHYYYIKCFQRRQLKIYAFSGKGDSKIKKLSPIKITKQCDNVCYTVI